MQSWRGVFGQHRARGGYEVPAMQALTWHRWWKGGLVRMIRSALSPRAMRSPASQVLTLHLGAFGWRVWLGE